MEDLKRFQGATFEKNEEKNWSKIEILSLNSLARFRNCNMKLIVMNDSRDFQDAESVRSGQSHVTSQSVFFPPYPDPGVMLSRSLRMPSRNDRPPSIWDTHVISGNVFCKSNSVFFSTFSARVEPMDL